MVDVVDKATRSRMMSGIRGKDTKPELELRRELHKLGFRYRLHKKGLPGKPDIVFPKYGAVCFVHGCFWHHHDGCRYATMPASRPSFWRAKFGQNQVRDTMNRTALLDLGLRVAIIWECSLKRDPVKVAETVAQWLKGNQSTLELPPTSNGITRSGG